MTVVRYNIFSYYDIVNVNPVRCTANNKRLFAAYVIVYGGYYVFDTSRTFPDFPRPEIRFDFGSFGTIEECLH